MVKIEQQRLFFALWPDDEVRLAIRRAQLALGLPARRLTHVADLHITVQYLGMVPPDKLPCLLAAADSVPKAPFEMPLTCVGYWRRPQVGWFAPEQTPEPLAALVGALGAELSACGYPPEARRYKPHVTLARHIRGLDGVVLSQPIPWHVRTLALVESAGGPPPHYHPIHTWELRA